MRFVKGTYPSVIIYKIKFQEYTKVILLKYILIYSIDSLPYTN